MSPDSCVRHSQTHLELLAVQHEGGAAASSSLIRACVSLSDFGVGPEGESFLSGLLHREEGQPTEKPGDQPGAEERGVRQAGEPAQEGWERGSK